MKELKDYTYRDIAKMLASALPLEAEDFRLAVESYLKVIKSMSVESKLALRSAYIFSRKVPREDREDMFQELTLAVLKAKTNEEKLAYTVARFDWKKWWVRQYSHTISTCGQSGRANECKHSTCEVPEKPAKSCQGCPYHGKTKMLQSLHTVTEDTDGNPSTIGELILGEVEFERKMNGKLDAEKIYDSLPADIKPIIDNRLVGKASTHSERRKLQYWVQKHGYKLLIA